MKNEIKTESTAPAGWQARLIGSNGNWIIYDSRGNVICETLNTTSKTERDLIASAPALLAERDTLKELLSLTQKAAIEVAEERNRLRAALVLCEHELTESLTPEGVKAGACTAIKAARAALAEGGKP